MTETGSCQADHKSILVDYWMEKAQESLLAGRSEYKSGGLQQPLETFIMPVSMPLPLCY